MVIVFVFNVVHSVQHMPWCFKNSNDCYFRCCFQRSLTFFTKTRTCQVDGCSELWSFTSKSRGTLRQISTGSRLAGPTFLNSMRADGLYGRPPDQSGLTKPMPHYAESEPSLRRIDWKGRPSARGSGSARCLVPPPPPHRRCNPADQGPASTMLCQHSRSRLTRDAVWSRPRPRSL